ncbi:MAG: YraN family protein [Halanaerobiaceae bacterium]
MTEFRQKLGNWGEKKAVEYLIERGYLIREKNYYNKYGEIDIIAEKNEILIFVEVKTYNNNRFGPPQGSVDFKKQLQIKKLAGFYLSNNNFKNLSIRFDVIAIKIKDRKGYLNHFQNAFY